MPRGASRLPNSRRTGGSPGAGFHCGLRRLPKQSDSALVLVTPRAFPPPPLATDQAILSPMTRLFEQAIAAVSALPGDAHDEAAHLLLQFVGRKSMNFASDPRKIAIRGMSNASSGHHRTEWSWRV
jgi:hypothetical protein